MKQIGKRMSVNTRQGQTVAHLVLNVGNITAGSLLDSQTALSPDMLFDDNAYFHVEE